jgi:hypothetical protein
MATSRAFVTFRLSLTLAQELLRIERETCRNPPKLHEQKAVEGLRGGACVLMVASFEQFLKDSVEEHLTNITAGSKKLLYERLPGKMIIHNTFITIEHATKGKPFDQAKDKIDRLPDIDTACQMIIKKQINPGAFTMTGGNPNPDTVKQMCANLGIRDVFGSIRPKFLKKWGKPVSHTFLVDKLKEVVNRRHVVAHSANALNVSRSDLRESMRFLRILAETLDNAIAAHIKRVRRDAQ